jgi:hypothetical protein
MNLKTWSKFNKVSGLQKQGKKKVIGGRPGCDCMVVGFTTTYAISAYHH